MTARDDYPTLADCEQSKYVGPDTRCEFAAALDEIDRLRTIADHIRAALNEGRVLRREARN